ncbi:MAG TPA: DUF3014 domain-containing protein [Vicinamibacterales bacterium]|nr:DUF3014 domain-containing protein [Vicinamibacterales bacterium]
MAGLDDYNLNLNRIPDRDRIEDVDRPFDLIDEPIDSYPSYSVPNRTGWLIGVVVILAIAGTVGYVLWKQRVSSPAAVTTTQPAPAAPQPAAEQPATQPAVVGENISLPPLAESDSIVRELVGRLSSHPSVAAWLATKGLISNFAVVTLSISEGRLPKSSLQSMAPRDPFLVTRSGTAVTLDPRSYQRYNKYAEAIQGLDALGTARLYATLKPRINDAYKELGYPDADFDRVLERAIGELLRTPILEGTVPLQRKAVSYTYADPRLESLSAAQKQFLRMGPRNVQAVQTKLREIAMLLALHPDTAPSSARR